MSSFKECVWTHFYKGVKEVISNNASDPRGKDVNVICFVDADHEWDTIIIRSRIVFFIFINMVPVIFHSKKKSETLSFGYEFVATKAVIEATRDLRYEPCMMGVPLSVPTYMYGDDM